MKINYNPDVLSCLANLSNDEVFTPPSLANEMLDLLPKDIWKNSSTKFLDPFSKSGVFLREIAKRLINGLEEEIPDQQKRINHILKNQIYGIAITELTSLLSRRSLYCSKTANGKYSICTTFKNKKGNIKYDKLNHTWDNKKCIYCCANQSNYDREDDLETHAYQFIHTKNPKEIFNMKFDVIIGNPPYQLDDGGHGKSAGPLYHKFIYQAKKLKPRFIVMIIPDRWFAGGKGLSDFRNKMLNDKKIKKLVDYTSASDVFPGIDIPGGICYFLWENSFNGKANIEIKTGNKIDKSIRYLNEFSTLIRYSTALQIIRNVKSKTNSFMNDMVSSRKPFGLPTNEKPKKEGTLFLKYNGGYGNYPDRLVTTGRDFIKQWKVITSKTSYDHAGQPNKEGKRQVFSTIEILEPNYICTETYIIVGVYNNKSDCENLVSYLQTKFVRFLVSQLSFSQDITKDRFAFVPTQNFSETWTDEKLYKKYDLNEEEIAFIDSMIRPMNLKKG